MFFICIELQIMIIRRGGNNNNNNANGERGGLQPTCWSWNGAQLELVG